MRLFVTGTDTDIGKTRVTAAFAAMCVARGERPTIVKAVQTGLAPGAPGDAAEAAALAGCAALEFARFRLPADPWSAAEAENAPLLDARRLAQQIESVAGTVIVEGAGGVAVPINPEETVATVIAQTSCAAVVVAGLRLGCISHTAAHRSPTSKRMGSRARCRTGGALGAVRSRRTLAQCTGDRNARAGSGPHRIRSRRAAQRRSRRNTLGQGWNPCLTPSPPRAASPSTKTACSAATCWPDFRRCPREDIGGLLTLADDVRRRASGDAAAVEVLFNAKMGGCSEDCHFCSQSARYATDVLAEPLRETHEFLTAAREAQARGAGEFCIVVAVRGPSNALLERVCEATRAIRADMPEMHVAVSLGILTDAHCAQLAEAGVHKINHNLETSRRHFPAICSTHSYDERWETCLRAKRHGFELCSGGIIGMGETAEDRLDFLCALQELGPVEVPINFLNPRPGTPLSDRSIVDPVEALRFGRDGAARATLRPRAPRRRTRDHVARLTGLGHAERRVGHRAGRLSPPPPAAKTQKTSRCSAVPVSPSKGRSSDRGSLNRGNDADRNGRAARERIADGERARTGGHRGNGKRAVGHGAGGDDAVAATHRIDLA